MGLGALPIPTQELADLCQKWHVARLALFGSVLRADFGPSSDVDVLVTFLPGLEPSLIGLAQLQQALSRLFDGRSVDIVTPGALHPLLREHILASAREQYAA